MNIYIVIVLTAACIGTCILVRRNRRQKKEENDYEYIYSGKQNRFEMLLCRLKEEIDAVLESDVESFGLDKAETQKRLKQQKQLRRTTREACLGDAGDREYLKEYIKELLQKKLGISERTITRIIPFDEPESMSAVECFEYMYMIYMRTAGVHSFSQMVADFGFAEPKTDVEGRHIYTVTEDDIRNAHVHLRYDGDYVDMLETLAQRCYEVLYGHDVADILIMDPDIDGVSGGVGGRTRIEYNYLEELMCGGDDMLRAPDSYDVIYCVWAGRLIRMEFLSFGNEQTLERVVKNIYRFNTKTFLSKKNPVLNASFRNNSRIVVSRPPVSDSWAFFVRKFASTNARSIESLITDDGSEMVIALLKAIVKAEVNFVVSGNTGGGKTTLVKSLVEYINPAYALRVIESSFELNINNLYPERNVHVMQERGDFTLYDAIAASKKMDTDVLILGEVNEPKVAGAFIQVAQSGSRMAITTLHHETTAKLIDYLRNALVSEFGISDVRIAEKQVVDSVNFDIHMVHDVDGHHFIERITQIIPSEDGPLPMEQGAAEREFYRRMTQPHGYELRDIIVFDREERKYVRVGEVSPGMGAKMQKAVGI